MCNSNETESARDISWPVSTVYQKIGGNAGAAAGERQDRQEGLSRGRGVQPGYRTKSSAAEADPAKTTGRSAANCQADSGKTEHRTQVATKSEVERGLCINSCCGM